MRCCRCSLYGFTIGVEDIDGAWMNARKVDVPRGQSCDGTRRQSDTDESIGRLGNVFFGQDMRILSTYSSEETGREVAIKYVSVHSAIG
jgi:hypothetical protein